MAIQLIDSIVSIFDAALTEAENAYWIEREAEFEDYSDYYHSAYPAF